MKKNFLYTYLGTNGTITSPVYLENIYSVRKVSLSAEENKILTDGKVYRKNVIVPEGQEKAWREIDDPGQY